MIPRLLDFENMFDGAGCLRQSLTTRFIYKPALWEVWYSQLDYLLHLCPPAFYEHAE